jgi:hypothetical protein
MAEDALTFVKNPLRIARQLGQQALQCRRDILRWAEANPQYADRLWQPVYDAFSDVLRRVDEAWFGRPSQDVLYNWNTHNPLHSDKSLTTSIREETQHFGRSPQTQQAAEPPSHDYAASARRFYGIPKEQSERQPPPPERGYGMER